jgi:hypothetical protein
MASAGVTLKSDPTVALDGEYTTSTTTGSSGDGVAGGDFSFRANVLSGDVNQTSPVNNSDVSLTKVRQGTTATTGGLYGAFFDVNGDGVAGGDFNFRANVLSGDVNQTSPVNNSDVSLTKNRQGTTATNPNGTLGNYGAFVDVNGDGVINNSDVSLVKNRQGTILPAADPTPAAPVASSAVTAPVVASKPVAKFAVKRIKKNDLLN